MFFGEWVEGCEVCTVSDVFGEGVQREGTVTEKALSPQVQFVWSCVVERGGLHRFRYEKCCVLICSFFTRQTRGIEGGGEKNLLVSVLWIQAFFYFLYKTVIMQRCKSQLAAIHLHGLPLQAELEVSCFLMVFEIISERMSLWRIAKLIQKSCGKSFLSAWLAPAVLKYLPAAVLPESCVFVFVCVYVLCVYL